jgi:cytochrome oxidase Cu insertion factor (SCO1/SenC/PrrC family)
VEKNRALKEELNIFFQNQPDAVKDLIVRLPVIDCTGAFWPFKGKWRDNLTENSGKEGIIIYGDWDGDMLEDYRLVEDDSNVILVDQKGNIRYFYSGLVPAEEIKKLKTLLSETLIEPSP